MLIFAFFFNFMRHCSQTLVKSGTMSPGPGASPLLMGQALILAPQWSIGSGPRPNAFVGHGPRRKIYRMRIRACTAHPCVYAVDSRILHSQCRMFFNRSQSAIDLWFHSDCSHFFPVEHFTKTPLPSHGTSNANSCMPRHRLG